MVLRSTHGVLVPICRASSLLLSFGLLEAGWTIILAHILQIWPDLLLAVIRHRAQHTPRPAVHSSGSTETTHPLAVFHESALNSVDLTSADHEGAWVFKFKRILPIHILPLPDASSSFFLRACFPIRKVLMHSKVYTPWLPSPSSPHLSLQTRTATP
jgi:hypothetical protein